MTICFIILIFLYCYPYHCFSRTTNLINPSFSIDYAHNTFLLDGKPFRYISGSIHYFRIHPNYWTDRLHRIRAAGLNAIQVYVPWNYHEVYKGRYYFDKQRNFTRFIELAAQQQLFVLLRIGPYICGEWENGGLPWWLIRDYRNMKLRTSDPRFLREVERWFGVLLPMIHKLLRKNGGPILMIQPENEYGSYDACDRKYTVWLRDLIRSYLGADVVQYTTDGAGPSYLKCGVIPEVYPTVDFGPTSNHASIEKSFATQRQYAPNGPLVNSEFYPGWLVIWGQKQQSLPPISMIIESSDYMYYLNASFDYYMFHGGTNFGYWNGAETNSAVITSYDYSAPISEAGDITEKYIAIRNWLASKWDWPTQPLYIPLNNPKIAYGKIKLQNVASFGRRLWHKVLESRSCKISRLPASFEDLNHPYGFVLYLAKLKFDGVNLTVPVLKDHGYVFVDDTPQGMLMDIYGRYSRKWIYLNGARAGAQLAIIVENRGRQTFETINDFKGILSNVTLDGRLVEEWIQCGLPLKLIEWIVMRVRGYRPYSHFHRYHETSGSAGIYVGQFQADYIADTFFNPTGWSKGQFFLNGHNIGRYWPTAGPQVTLYVPAPYLKRHNTIIVIELKKAGNCVDISCIIEFTDHPIFNFTEKT